tara:strand:+ start:217 stop:555 length:339 start_codon:yes stop_codon:yes gene_type:complete
MKRLILLCVLSALCITSCSKKEAILLDDSYTLTLYPNPVREGQVFSLYLSPWGGVENTFRLINKNGEVFWETTYASSNLNVSTYGIPPGIYILECETDHGLLREELVIYPGL